MDRIETETAIHVLDDVTRNVPDADGNRTQRTWCGRTVTGRTGVCSPMMISCGNCKRRMRRDGYRV